VVAPLPADDFAVADSDEQAPAWAQVNPVDLDLVKDLAGLVQVRIHVPAPLGLVAEGPASAASVVGLGLLAQQPVDEADEDVALGRIWSLMSGRGIAVNTSPSLLAVAFPVLLLRTLADTT